MKRKRFNRNIVGSSDAYKGYSHKLFVIEVHNNMSDKEKELLNSLAEINSLKSFEMGVKRSLEKYKANKG